MTTPYTKATLSLISLTLIAFAGIVAGETENRQTNLTTETYKSSDTTPLQYLKNETKDEETTRTSPTTHPTVQTTHFTTTDPKAVTLKQETTSKPKPVLNSVRLYINTTHMLRLRPRSSTITTTVKMITVPNVTVPSNVPNETDPIKGATTPGMINRNSSGGIYVTKPQPNTITITVPSTEGKTTEATKTDSLKRSSLPRERKPETTPTPTTSTEETTFFQKPENSTLSTEVRDMEKDFIERELDDTFNSMPKLPELVLSNDTHFEFHQDPEEASLDERITQIARQLAETGLRREYEERKLGHVIPISVRPVDHVSTPNYRSKSKSIKFPKSESPTHYKSSLLKVLTKSKSSPSTENLNKTAYEIVTNLPEILRKNKSDKQIREINGLIKVGKKGSDS